VAAFERVLRPIADWSMVMILSRYSQPVMLSYSPGISVEL
jgi:hypothetical protein